MKWILVLWLVVGGAKPMFLINPSEFDSRKECWEQLKLPDVQFGPTVIVRAACVPSQKPQSASL